MEAEAILTILKFIENGQWTLLNSDGIFYEINKIPDPERRMKIRFMVSKTRHHIKGKADIFLTTDDNLLKKLNQHAEKIKVKAANPLVWIKEVLYNGSKS